MPVEEFNRTNGIEPYPWIDAIIPNDEVDVQAYIDAYLEEHADELDDEEDNEETDE